MKSKKVEVLKNGPHFGVAVTFGGGGGGWGALHSGITRKVRTWRYFRWASTFGTLRYLSCRPRARGERGAQVTRDGLDTNPARDSCSALASCQVSPATKTELWWTDRNIYPCSGSILDVWVSKEARGSYLEGHQSNLSAKRSIFAELRAIMSMNAGLTSVKLLCKQLSKLFSPAIQEDTHTFELMLLLNKVRTLLKCDF